MSVSEIKPQSPAVSRPLPAWVRFYLYGMHGLLDEIVFTALFDLVFEPDGNRQLKGYSTIFTFFIYGSCSFCVERLYVFLYIQNGVKFSYRLPLYFAILYAWEFFCGLVLRQFDACSWDYSHYPLNLMGLVTLVYAPVWLIAILFNDFLFGFLLSLRITSNGNQGKLTTKEN